MMRRIARGGSKGPASAKPDEGEDEQEISGGLAAGDLAIWILIPAAGYLGGALYQAGYAYYFGVPVETLSTESIAIFQAIQSYIDLLLNHFTARMALPLLFILYLAMLPRQFFVRWQIGILIYAIFVFLVSFSIRPWAWSLLGILLLLAARIVPALLHALLHVPERSPVKSRINSGLLKAFSISLFLFSTLYAVGYASAYYQRQFYITDGEKRFVVLSFQSAQMLGVPLVDPKCRVAKELPDTLDGYFFGDDIKYWNLGDADTPEVHVFDTTGLRDANGCGASSPSRSSSS